MNRGRIEQIGAPFDLYRRPATKFVAEFLGEINWINGTALRPESIQLAREAPDSRVVSVPALVERSTFLGNRIQVETRLSSGQVCLVESSAQGAFYKPEERVYLWWHASDELQIASAAHT
ncbi:MAG: TOBE domain-containing protein [Acidobacteriaceae bacterium]|nr:TOBE domain-containing protein [Acidobacteriaceae bacterium]